MLTVSFHPACSPSTGWSRYGTEEFYESVPWPSASGWWQIPFYCPGPLQYFPVRAGECNDNKVHLLCINMNSPLVEQGTISHCKWKGQLDMKVVDWWHCTCIQLVRGHSSETLHKELLHRWLAHRYIHCKVSVVEASETSGSTSLSVLPADFAVGCIAYHHITHINGPTSPPARSSNQSNRGYMCATYELVIRAVSHTEWAFGVSSFGTQRR